MLRSLYSATSGMNAQQTKLDVTANNIANVATVGFKKSSVQFADTLSQTLRAAGGPNAETGGINPAQVGLGVKVAAITSQFTQGSSEATGVGTDLMIEGDGFFTVRKGGQMQYTRAGAFAVDEEMRLVAPDGSRVQGWMGDVNGVITVGGVPGDLTMPSNLTTSATATVNVTLSGNLPADAAPGTALIRDVTIYDAEGNESTMGLTYTRTGTGWDITEGGAAVGTVEYFEGVLTSAPTFTTPGGIVVDMSRTSGYASLETLSVREQDGSPAGTLSSYSFGANGSVIGVFTNGEVKAVAQLAMASFDNNAGLDRAGNSAFTMSANSGPARYSTANTNTVGGIASGSLEMSNVDLSSEMVNLITSQRALQSSSRVLTTSDTILEELVNLKR